MLQIKNIIIGFFCLFIFTGCAQSQMRSGYLQTKDLNNYINSSAYSEYKVAEFRKVLPQDLKDCKNNIAPSKRTVITQVPARFKFVPNPVLMLSHVYGNPIEGIWKERQIIHACGQTIGTEIRATAVPDHLPNLEIKILRKVNSEEFMKGK